ncbi:MAG: hypothetical protein FYV88_2070, partial [Bacteroidetes bacterium]|nr:hypothetical protein [Bacteroidota bacterium]
MHVFTSKLRFKFPYFLVDKRGGFQELLVIGLVVLVLFGGKKIPEFMKGLGKGIREFNDA